MNSLCTNCGKQFKPLRRSAKFCTDACRQAAHRGRSYRNKRGFSTRPDSRYRRTQINAPAAGFFENPQLALQNTHEKTKASGQAISTEIRGRGWQAPSRVIEAHFPAGAEMVSADGVRSFVVQLQRRALVEHR
jgi:hypothetical protein